MDNKFEHLKFDSKKDLPEPWYNYPVLSEYDTILIYTKGRDYLRSLIGQQDGYWVAGVDIHIGGSSTGFLPGRKWGYFATRDKALLWTLGYMLSFRRVTGKIRKSVLDKIESVRQLSLFG